MLDIIRSLTETQLMFIVPILMVALIYGLWRFSVWMKQVEAWSKSYIENDDNPVYKKLLALIPLGLAYIWLVLVAIVALGILAMGAHQLANRGKEWWQK